MNNKRYFSDAQEDSKQRFFAADGWDADGGDNFNAFGFPWMRRAAAAAPAAPAAHPAVQAFHGTFGFPPPPGMSHEEMAYHAQNHAASNRVAPMASTGKSRPLIIQLVNNSTSAIANVDIFDAYKNQGLANQGLNSNITVSILSGTASYLQILVNSGVQPVEVGEFLFNSSTAGQLTQTFNLTKNSDNGHSETDTIVFVTDIYQNSTSQVVYDTPFIIDGYTGLTLTSLLASATVTLYFYPKKRVELAMATQGGGLTVQHGNPGTMRGINSVSQLLKSGL